MDQKQEEVKNKIEDSKEHRIDYDIGLEKDMLIRESMIRGIYTNKDGSEVMTAKRIVEHIIYKEDEIDQILTFMFNSGLICSVLEYFYKSGTPDMNMTVNLIKRNMYDALKYEPVRYNIDKLDLDDTLQSMENLNNMITYIHPGVNIIGECDTLRKLSLKILQSDLDNLVKLKKVMIEEENAPKIVKEQLLQFDRLFGSIHDIIDSKGIKIIATKNNDEREPKANQDYKLNKKLYTESMKKTLIKKTLLLCVFMYKLVELERIWKVLSTIEYES